MTTANSEMFTVNVDDSYVFLEKQELVLWCFWCVLCWFWVLFPCTAQALLKMDCAREYGICSILSAGEKYGDMKASWLKASCVEGALINMVA